MNKKSAGIVMYRQQGGIYEVLLVHPGGPFWAKKDLQAWSIPKGEFGDDEDPSSAARREFKEETGFTADGEPVPLETVKQPGGKIIYPWAVEGDIPASEIKSNTFTLEWPPRSGSMKEFPEVDRGEWFSFGVARQKILKGQTAILDQLAAKLGLDKNDTENGVQD